MSEQEMMERYIYEVVRRVPQEMREEIRMELGELIEDMRSGEGLSLEAVLEKLGDPAQFARRYRGESNYLIGPEYYDDYVWILKIVLIGIGISAVVSAFVNGVTGTGAPALSGQAAEGLETVRTGGIVSLCVHFFAELFTSAFSGALGAVGVVTAIFAFLEWRRVKVSVKPEKSWNVGELTRNAASAKTWTPFLLPAIPDKRAVISRGDSVFSIVFISILAALLAFVPELFGAFHYEDGTLKSIACVFNLKEWGSIAPVLLFTIGVGLVDECIRLATGYYCRAVMYSTVVCNIIQAAGAAILFLVFPIWNPDFARKIQEMAGIAEFSEWDLLRFWNTEGWNRILFLIILGCCLLEVGVAVYKTLKYDRR